MADLGKVGIIMKGNYSSSSAYEMLDAVTYNNGLYIAKQDAPAGTAPTNTSYWQLAVDLAAITTQVNNIAAKITTPLVAVFAPDDVTADANDIKTTGAYTVRSTSTANLPGAGIWEMIVISYLGGVRVMQFCTAAGANTIYFRGFNGTSWDNWTALS